ncbi:Reverse transcriptase [Camponotus japonicus]
MDLETLSDHAYIIFKINMNEVSPMLRRKKKYIRWAHKKMDADRYREALTWKCVNHTHDEEDVNKMARWTHEVITEACNYSMPIVTNVRRESVYWWNSQIAEARTECNQARRKWQKMKKNKTVTDILLAEESYRSKKKILCTLIKKAKTQAWNDLIRSIEEDPWGLPYRIVMKKLRRSTPSFGETLPIEILEQLVDRLFPQDPLHNESIIEEEVNEPWLEEYDISIEEISNILKKKTGANKAPGIDGIKSTFLKKVSLEFLKELTFVYNQCLRRGTFANIWKKSLLILLPKGVQDAAISKARPICLISELGKLLESVIDNRIHDWMDRHPESQLAKNQFGFRKNTSTCDALLIVQEIVTEAKLNGEIVIGISLDITNAFNSIRWCNIRRALKEKQFPQYLRRIIDDYLSNREIEYPTIQGTTITRSHCGCSAGIGPWISS